MSRRKSVLLASLVASAMFVSTSAMGCINIMGTNVSGQQVDADVCTHGLTDIVAHRQKFDLAAELLEIEAETAAEPSFENRNDLAAMAMRNGQHDRAYNLLVALEEEEPGHYVVAANLGTALELLGRDDEAREWIAKGIERNVDNHYGTEWIHLSIFDAKRALAHDPSWLMTHSVLGSDFGATDAPTLRVPLPAGNDGKPITEARAVQLGICYQMMERLPFTRAPDPVVGSLLFDAGNIAFRHDTLENALALYNLAAKYTVADPALLDRRIAHTKQLLARLGPKPQQLKRSK